MTHKKLSTILSLQSCQDTQIKTDNKLLYQNILAAPSIGINTTNFTISIDGQQKDYNKQILTPMGLKIYSTEGNNMEADKNKIQCILQSKQSIKFDRKYLENKYCGQLALTLDHSTNAAYQIVKKYRNIKNKQNVCPPLYNLQICSLILKKIPIKAKCLQLVFKKISLHKIQILLENNSFFQQLIKFISQLIYKVNIDSINPKYKQNKNIITKNDQDSQQSLSNTIQNQQIGCAQERKNGQNQHKKSTFYQKKKKLKLTYFQQRVLNIFFHISEAITKLKKGYERVNLILGMFTRQERLSQFFYQLNKQLVCEYIAQNLHEIFGNNQLNSNKCDKKSKIADARNTKMNTEFQSLSKLIQCIKTINTSLGKSQSSFKIIKNVLLTQQLTIPWLHINFQQIKSHRKTACKYFQFISLAVQINPLFVCTYYSCHSIEINALLATQIKWIFQTLNTALPNFAQQAQLKDEANKCLDDIIAICKLTVKQTLSPINFGRAICKQLSETVISLRPRDIQFFTFVGIVNPYSRQQVINFLFCYFRKFISQFKSDLAASQYSAIKLLRIKKHYFIQVLQSIRKISQIDEVDFTIDLHLLDDIKSILQFYTQKSVRNNNHQDRANNQNNCIVGAYRAMIKNIRIEPSKQKDSQSQTYDSEQVRFNIKYN